MLPEGIERQTKAPHVSSPDLQDRARLLAGGPVLRTSVRLNMHDFSVIRLSHTRHGLQDAASSSGEEDEDDVPIRRSQAPRSIAIADSDDEAEAAPAQKPAAPAAKPKAASRQPAKRKTVLDEASDSEDDWEAPKQAAGAHADPDCCSDWKDNNLPLGGPSSTMLHPMLAHWPSPKHNVPAMAISFATYCLSSRSAQPWK